MRIIKEFIRDFDNKPYGCMVATVVEQNGLEFVSIGVSLCHEHDKNKWNKHLATDIALGRAEKVNKKFRLPQVGCKSDEGYFTLHADDLEKFMKRARSYFQDKFIILPNIEWF